MGNFTQLGSKITSGVSTTGNALNLADNILDNDTIVGDFMDMGEGNEFLTSILSGIKDFLHKIGEAYGFLKNLIAKVLDFVNKILSYLDLNKLFDALGIKYLLDLITTVVGATLFTGVLGDRQDFMSLLQKGCIDIDTDALRNPFSMFILAGIIMSLGCSGESRSFSLLDTTLKFETKEKYDLEMDSLKTELSVIDGLDSLDPAVLAIATAAQDALLVRELELTNAYEAEMERVDDIIHKTMFVSFVHAKPSSVENLLLDMSTLPSFTNSRYLSNSSIILPFIDKMVPEELEALDYAKLKDILNLFDPALITTPSTVLASLARDSIKSKPLSLSPTDITTDMLTLVKPSLGEYEPC